MGLILAETMSLLFNNGVRKKSHHRPVLPLLNLIPCDKKEGQRVVTALLQPGEYCPFLWLPDIACHFINRPIFLMEIYLFQKNNYNF